MEDAGDGLIIQINREARSQEVHTRDGECRRTLWEVNADGGEARDEGCPSTARIAAHLVQGGPARPSADSLYRYRRSR